MPRRIADGWIALVTGLGYVGLAPLAARDPGSWERTAFRTVNHTGGKIHALRIPQQMGTPWVLPGLALLGFQTHRPRLAVTAGLALPLEKSLEVGVKKMARRRRPAQALPDADLRDDAPASGPSYPSGHAAIAFAAVVLAAPYLPTVATLALGTGAALTSLTRVHQGAHYPLDAVGGALLGTAAGSMLKATFRRGPA
jgi:membrane-associated phospholipid phosphatase